MHYHLTIYLDHTSDCMDIFELKANLAIRIGWTYLQISITLA